MYNFIFVCNLFAITFLFIEYSTKLSKLVQTQYKHGPLYLIFPCTKVDCGYNNINSTQCVNRGCCCNIHFTLLFNIQYHFLESHFKTI